MEIKVRTLIEAILATIYFDDIIGIKYEMCSREGCDRIYEVTSIHQLKYCRKHALQSSRAYKKATRRSQTA